MCKLKRVEISEGEQGSGGQLRYALRASLRASL
jgi:hypothetical protein